MNTSFTKASFYDNLPSRTTTPCPYLSDRLFVKDESTLS